VPEDRQRDGLAQNLSVRDNLSLSSLTAFVKGLFVSDRAVTSAADRQIADVRLKTPSATALVTALSGGNQQKVVIGKILMTEPTVLLLDEPSRGIDVGAKAEIFALMAREAKKGLAVLYATSEVSEALGVANSIVVMSRGRIVDRFDPRDVTREAIMSAADEAGDGIPDLASAVQPNPGAEQ
jgi:erythritol transport system ATP-binding protein